jgi:hypothetical protein
MESVQIDTFRTPDSFATKAYSPIAVLFEPVVFLKRVLDPIAVFQNPVVLDWRALFPIAVFSSPMIFIWRAPLPMEVFDRIFHHPLPTVIPLIVASAMVTRLPLAPERRNASILFRLNTRSWLSVVPMN